MQQTDFEKLLADTLAAHGRSPRTQETYTLMLRLFGRYLDKTYGGRTLDIVLPEDVETYQRYLVTERKVGFSSFNQATCALRFFYQTCLGKTDWTIARMPYQRKRRTLPEILSPEDLVAMFEACNNLKHKTLLMTSYSGGLRLGETLGLLPSDIDGKRMMIRVEQGKGHKDRYTVLSTPALGLLEELWRAYRPAEYFFTGQDGIHPICDATAQSAYYAALRRSGVRRVGGIHVLRHCFATHLMEDGVDIYTIRRWMGHTSLVTTGRYMHVTREHLAKIKSPLDSLYEEV